MDLILSKYQGQGQAKKGQQMSMLHECRATHLWRVILDAEIDGGILFQVLPDERSMSGQTRPNKVKFSNPTFSYKNMPILSSFVSGFQNCYLFLRTTIINAKKCI